MFCSGSIRKGFLGFQRSILQPPVEINLIQNYANKAEEDVLHDKGGCFKLHGE